MQSRQAALSRHWQVLHATWLAFAFFAAPAPINAGTLDKIKETGIITIAFRESSVPFSYLDSKKQPTGFSIDLCKRIVESMRQQLKIPQLQTKWLMVTGAERISAIRDGKADIECGNTTNTPDRRKEVAFAIPTFVAGISVMSPASRPLTEMADFSGHKIIAPAGSTALKLLTGRNEKYNAGITLLQTKDNAESMQALEKASADAWMTDDILLYFYRASAQNPKNWTIRARRFSVEPLALMYRKNDAPLADLVNQEIRKMMLSGDFKTLYARWFMQPLPEMGININIEMSELLRSFVTHPTSELPVNF